VIGVNWLDQLDRKSFNANLSLQIISFIFNRDVVTIILSGQSRDDVLDIIHNRLRELGDAMRAGKIDIEQYEINRVN
jgi:hypothetical protein